VPQGERCVDECALEDACDQIGVADEARQLIIDRPGVEVLRRGVLDDPAVAENSDEIRERERLVLVVGHEQRRGRRCAEDPLNLVAHAGAHLRVE
jgi:hypothetical protein